MSQDEDWSQDPDDESPSRLCKGKYLVLTEITYRILVPEVNQYIRVVHSPPVLALMIVGNAMSTGGCDSTQRSAKFPGSIDHV